MQGKKKTPTIEDTLKAGGIKLLQRDQGDIIFIFY